MRYRIAALAGVGIAVALVVGACNPDRLTKVNVDPNNPTSAPPAAVFTNAVRVAMQVWYGSNPANMRGPVLTAQHLAQVQYPDEDQYLRLDAATTEGIFLNTYISELKNFQAVIDAGKTEPARPNIFGPAQVMRSLIFGYATDVWGDVPYSEALQGDNVAGTILPAYDTQTAIYDGLFADLAAAVTAMDAGQGTPGLGAADPIYSGNAAQWMRFANSLRARHAMRLVNVDAPRAQAQLAAAIAAPGGLIESNADNARMPWPGDGIYDNPWAVNNRTRDDHRLSQTLMNELVPRNDPRVPVFAQPTLCFQQGQACAEYAGMPNALTASQAGNYSLTSSRPGRVFYSTNRFCAGCTGLIGASWPSFILTYSEVQFILAEARERGMIATGTAAGYYEEGIRASMAQWGVTDQTAIDNYVARADVAYQAGTEGLRRIALQKWIALFGDGVQAWAEWRRTCIPTTLVPGPAATINTVPRRYQYPPREHAVNGTNVAAAIARQGQDNFLSRMYWDGGAANAPTYPGASCGVRP